MAIERKPVLSSAFPSFTSLKDTSVTPGLNMVIFGPPGVGKTTFIGGIVKAQPDSRMLLFDIDVGRESVLDLDGIDLAVSPAYANAQAKGESTEGIEPKLTWQELREYLDLALALKDKSPYGAYGFDSLSSIYYELLFPWVEKKMGPGKDGRQYYFEAQKHLTKFVRDAKALCEYGIHTLFTGHIKEEKDEDITNIRLSLPQGVRNEILLAVNHVGYLTRGKDNETRELYLRPPNKRVEGPKLRQTQSGKQVPLVIQNPKMTDLIAQIQKGN